MRIQAHTEHDISGTDEDDIEVIAKATTSCSDPIESSSAPCGEISGKSSWGASKRTTSTKRLDTQLVHGYEPRGVD
ncbi:hypothetical protein PHLCEN_2v10060 [Hermanssonia centrifuga]|uniref:Uncharacterized protein n=1 Tax=Hermanssonia centrifuga TaxID=98765 RepID=A0A2R6NNT1_9APHY|nr:hypothetical protein PHLCEN_2v10060 [Hermanssonia centrifuga]